MTPERIAELRALAEAATPGPWGVGARGPDHDMHPVVMSTADGVRAVADFAAVVSPQSDARFIAAARTALPEALNEIERLWLYIESKKMREGI